MKFTQSDGELLRIMCEQLCEDRFSIEKVIKHVHKIDEYLAQFREAGNE